MKPWESPTGRNSDGHPKFGKMTTDSIEDTARKAFSKLLNAFFIVLIPKDTYRSRWCRHVVLQHP